MAWGTPCDVEVSLKVCPHSGQHFKLQADGLIRGVVMRGKLFVPKTPLLCSLVFLFSTCLRAVFLLCQQCLTIEISFHRPLDSDVHAEDGGHQHRRNYFRHDYGTVRGRV